MKRDAKIGTLRIPGLRESLAIAAVVVLIGFFSLHLYYPSLGLLGNALDGEIWLTDGCLISDMLCGVTFRFRWVLIAMVLFVALCGYLESRRKKKAG